MFMFETPWLNISLGKFLYKKIASSKHFSEWDNEASECGIDYLGPLFNNTEQL